MQPAGLSNGTAPSRPQPCDSAVQSSVPHNLASLHRTLSPVLSATVPSSGSDPTVRLLHEAPPTTTYNPAGQPPGVSSFLLGSPAGSVPFLSVPHITVNICPNGSRTTITRTGESSVSLSVGGAPTDSAPAYGGSVLASPLVSVSIIGVASPASDVKLLGQPLSSASSATGTRSSLSPARSHLHEHPSKQAYPLITPCSQRCPPCVTDPGGEVFSAPSSLLLPPPQQPGGLPPCSDEATGISLGGLPLTVKHHIAAPPLSSSASPQLRFCAAPGTSVVGRHGSPRRLYNSWAGDFRPCRSSHAVRFPSAVFPGRTNRYPSTQTPGARRRPASVPIRETMPPPLAAPEPTQQIIPAAPHPRVGDPAAVRGVGCVSTGSAAANAAEDCCRPRRAEAGFPQSTPADEQIHVGGSLPFCQLVHENELSSSCPTFAALPGSERSANLVCRSAFPAVPSGGTLPKSAKQRILPCPAISRKPRVHISGVLRIHAIPMCVTVGFERESTCLQSQPLFA